MPRWASLGEMDDLLELAENYCDGSSMSQCKYLYRNQSRNYFDKIKHKGGMMVTEMKDDGGDPKSPINGNLKGLFFTASVRGDTGQPLPTSPYGPSRFSVPTDYLIDTDDYNISFADFYCVGSKYHYIILVISKNDSKPNNFCEDNLPCLDWNKNVFFRCSRSNNFWVTTADNCIIEVFFTESIHFKKAFEDGDAFITHNIPVNTRGKNIKKNLRCSTCNVQYDTRKTNKKRKQPKLPIEPREPCGALWRVGTSNRISTQNNTNICNLSVNDSTIPFRSNHDYSEVNNNLPPLKNSFRIQNVETHLLRTNTKPIQISSIHFSPIRLEDKLSNNVALVRGSIRSSQMSMTNQKQNLDVNTRISYRGVSSVKGITGNQSMTNQKHNLEINARTSFRGVPPAKEITRNQNMIPPSTQKFIKPDNKISFQDGNLSEIIKIADVKNDVDNKLKIVDNKDKRNKMDDNNKENKKKEQTEKISTFAKFCCTIL